MIRSIRDEAFLLLEGRGAILDTARDVTRVMREAGVDGAVIGGVAVTLHGYVRTTVDVDVYVAGSSRDLAKALKSAGYAFSRTQREFRKEHVPVHLVSSDQLGMAPSERIELEDVQTVGLADLIGMKLASGLKNPVRAIDLADVIGLIRHRRLGPPFASKLAKELRPDFRKLARAVAREDARRR